jgi:hypothetical protein
MSASGLVRIATGVPLDPVTLVSFGRRTRRHVAHVVAGATVDDGGVLVYWPLERMSGRSVFFPRAQT